MPLLNIPVLMSLAGLNLLAGESVMPQQSFVGPRELSGINQVIYRGAHPVRPMLLRHAAQLPKCVLQALAEAFKTFRIADCTRLPVRIAEHEVINQMREGLPVDRDCQLAAVREIRLA